VKLKEITDNKKLLVKEEKKITARLKDLKKKGDNFKQNMFDMIESKKRIEDSLRKRYDLLLKLEDEWNLKDKALKDDELLLEELKTSLTKLSKGLKIDINTLDEKEKKIIKEAEKIEKDKKLISRKEKEITEKINKLESLEKSIGGREGKLYRKEIELSGKEQKIKRVQELKQDLLKLEARHRELSNKVKQEEKKLDKITKESVAKWELLKDRELVIGKKEKEVKEEEAELKIKEEALEELEKHKLELISKEAKPVEVVFEGFEKSKHPEIYALIAEARKLIRTKQLDEAKKFIRKIQSNYNKIKKTDEEKLKISYDLLELKTDVKLAALE